MNQSILAEKKYKYILIILAIGAVLVNLKGIFTDYNYDSGYAVAVAYRMLQGDGMFAEMWEPHQTSAFLCAGLMWLYLLITGTTTGIVLYLQMAGVVIKALMTLFFYHTMKKMIRKDVLALMCMFFFTVTPKGLPMPEFSNMQIWFSVGLFCSIIRFLQEQEKGGWLVAAALFLCLEVLTYPSCLIVYAGVIALLCRYGKQKWQDCLVFSSICFVCGAVYIGYFVVRLGAQTFLENIGYIVKGDGSHDSTFVEKWLAYLQECGELLIGLAGLAVVSWLFLKLISVLVYYISGKKRDLSVKKYWGISFFGLFLVCDMMQALRVEMTYAERLPIYVPIIMVAILALDKCEKAEKQIVVCGLFISFLNFLATLGLTNLTVGATLNYLILAVMVAFIPIMKWIEVFVAADKRWLHYSVVLLFCAVTVFRSGYIMKCMSTEKTNVLKIAGTVKDGPAKGLVSEYMGPYMLNATLTEWKSYVKKGDRVLIVSGLYDPLQYMFEEVEIANPSTICTSTYDALLLEYWERYPQKAPNVVVVDCWYGALRVQEDSWIMQWLKSEFKSVDYIDGSYWRYYRR